jgi:phage anti-repressor protein
MNEIIKIDSNNKVSGRELHEFLEVGRDFTTWMKQMVGYGFNEYTDYEVYTVSGENPSGGRPAVDYIMTIDMAKEICMIQRTDKGKQARQYFIECERRLKKPMSQLELMVASAQQLLEHDRAIKEIEAHQANTDKRLDGMKEVISLSSDSWRKDTTSLLNKMAIKAGNISLVRDFRHESYKILNGRMGVSLETRLVNMKRRMYEAGFSKTKIDGINALDVIEQDKKLIEGYVAIIKELAIKYGVAE